MKTIWCISFLFLSTVLNAQVTFQKKFGHPQSNVDENVTDAALDPWGNMYITGSNNLFTFNLAKVDTLGTTHWMKRLSTLKLAPQNIICSVDSNLVLAGMASNGQSFGPFYLCIMKTDTAANIIWSRYLDFDSTSIYVTFLFEDSDGNLVTGGYLDAGFDSVLTFKTNPFIAKFDSAGMLLWYKRMLGVQTFAFNDCILLDNGNYQMVGYAGDTILGGKDVLLVETDTSGSVIRSMVLGNASDDWGLKVLQQNKMILIDSYDNNSATTQCSHLIQIDSTWSIIQNRKILISGSSIKDIIPYSNSTFLVSADEPMVYLIDSTLQFIEGRRYGGGGTFNRVDKSFDVGNGRIFSVGAAGFNVEVLVFRTDSLWDPGCNSTLAPNYSDTILPIQTEAIIIYSIDTLFLTFSFDTVISNYWLEQVLCSSYTGINDLSITNHESLNIYPNPTDEWINFNSKIFSESTIWSICIYDILGNNVKTLLDLEISNSSKSLNVGTLQNGVYLIVLKGNDEHVYSKFTILR